MGSYVNIGKQVYVGDNVPNIDAKYGPYASKEHAIETLGEDGMDVIAEGLTIGIIKDNKIVEHWFVGGIDIEHLVPKYDNDLVWE